MALTPKRLRFVLEYLKDLNATQAYIRAGYSVKGANKLSARLMANEDIRAEIAKRQLKRLERIEVDQDYVLRNLTEVVERTMQRAPVLEFDRDKKAMVQAQDEDGKNLWTFDAKNAVASLGLLAKHTGGFSERHEHRFPDMTPEDRTNRVAALLGSAKERKLAQEAANYTNGNGNGNGRSR